MFVHKNSAVTSIFSLMILVGISFFWGALFLSNLRISFSISSAYFFEMKYFVALFLNCKNARVTFILQNGFENWTINVFSN